MELLSHASPMLASPPATSPPGSASPPAVLSPELDMSPPMDKTLWERAWTIAEEVYDDKADPRVEGALFYHSRYIRPRWARRKKPIAKIGNHVFY